MRSSAAIPWWLLGLLLLGGWLAWSSLDVGFLSDDYLMVRYWERDLGAVRWDRVAADLQGPWFGVRDLYRPLVTVSCALQLALHGFAARGFHLANAAMLLGAALAIAALVRLRFPRDPGLLACCAGALLLVHPSVVEPGHWIMARTTALEVFFSAASMALYGAFLHGRLASRWPAFVAMACALGSKEGALLLPVSLVAVDVLHARGSLAARVQGLRPFFVLLAAMLLFRKLALGTFTTAKESLAADGVLAGMLRHAAWLLGPAGMGAACAGVLLALLVVPWAARQPRRALGFGLWLALLLVPASHVPSVEGGYDGRLVYPLMPSLALLLVESVAGAPRPRWALALAVGFVVAVATATPRLAGDYRQGGAAVTAFGRELATAAAAAAPGRPVAPAAVTLPAVGLQLVQTKLWGLLAQRPFAPQDGAVVSLESLLPRGNQLGADAVDGTPAQAVLAAGGRLANWTGSALAQWPRPAVGDVELLGVPDRPGLFRAAAPWQPFAATVLEVELAAPATGCELRLAVDVPGAAGLGVRQAASPQPTRTFWFDLAPPLVPLVLQGLGAPWPDCELRTPQGPVGAARVRAHGDAALLPVPPLAGAEVVLEQLAARLPRPQQPATLYLLLPTTTVAVPSQPNSAWTLTPAAIRELEFARELLGRVVVHCCWRTDGGAQPPSRSALDWFVLR